MAPNPLNVIAQDPVDEEAEIAVIGCIITDGSSIEKVSDDLVPDDFYSRLNGEIFDVMLQLEEKGCPIDIIIVSKELKKRKVHPDTITSYLIDCVNSIPSSYNIKQYAKSVKEKSALRAIIKTATAIQEMGREEMADADDLLDIAEQGLFNISTKKGKKRYRKISDFTKDIVDKFGKIVSGEISPGLMTGLKGLDDILAGFHKSDLIIVGARPSVGKTAVAISIANNVLKRKVPVALFSLEMSREQVGERLFSMNSGVGLQNIRSGIFKSKEEIDDAVSKINKVKDEIDNFPLVVDDSPSLSILEIKRACRRIRAEYKDLGLVIVDYLQLIRPRKDDGKTNDQVAEISKGLKALAKEVDVPVLALSQLSRNIEQRESSTPRLSDLRDSGSIEQDADVVMFISRGSDMGDGNPPVDLIVAKHRNGPLGNARVKWNKETASFN